MGRRGASPSDDEDRPLDGRITTRGRRVLMLIVNWPSRPASGGGRSPVIHDRVAAWGGAGANDIEEYVISPSGSTDANGVN